MFERPDPCRQFATPNSRGQVRDHDNIDLSYPEARVEARHRDDAELVNDQRYDKAGIIIVNTVGLAIKDQTAVSQSKDVELRHQNCRYFSSGRPCSSTHLFQ